jgi:hypothetical protein
MNKSNIEAGQPGQQNNSEQTAQDQQVSQPNANTNVGRSDFWVECNVCKQRLKNWVGSTPCCGSIAWVVENNKPTKNFVMFVKSN